MSALTDIAVDIKNVVYSQVFGAGLDKSDHLEYILFGHAPEFFLAHVIAAPPDFDQVLSVKIDNPPAPDELARGVRVSLLEQGQLFIQETEGRRKASRRRATLPERINSWRWIFMQGRSSIWKRGAGFGDDAWGML